MYVKEYYCVCVCVVSSVSGQVPMADFSEHCKVSAGFINSVEFFDQMNW